MAPRFWSSSPLCVGLSELPEQEAHHARHVLRLVAGSEIEVFDGAGRWGKATLHEVGKRGVQFLLPELQESRSPQDSLMIAVALPKGERADWLVEKATELGVTELIPIRTDRSQVDPRDSKLDRLRQIVIAACKQSRRLHAMKIQSPRHWSDLLEDWKSLGFCMAHPQGRPFSALIGATNTVGVAEPSLPCRITRVAIGPEGGWSEAELKAAEEAGAKRLTLGPTILRIETAVVCLASQWLGYVAQNEGTTTSAEEQGD